MLWPTHVRRCDAPPGRPGMSSSAAKDTIRLPSGERVRCIRSPIAWPRRMRFGRRSMTNARANGEILSHAYQLARFERSPSRGVVQRLTCHHDRGVTTKIRNVHSHGPAHMMQITPSELTPGLTLEHEESMRLGIAKRPELIPRREHEVQRRHVKVLGDPIDGRRDPRADAAARPYLLRDEGEVALGVRLPSDEAHVTAELRLQGIEIFEHAVVGKEHSVNNERLRVLSRPLPGRRVPDVRDERRGTDVFRLPHRGRILVGRQSLLVDDSADDGREIAQPSPVRVSQTLLEQRVRGLEKPEARMHAIGRGGQAEQPAHGYVTARRT